MATALNKRERENKKRDERTRKEEKRLERKENAGKGKSIDEMMATNEKSVCNWLVNT